MLVCCVSVNFIDVLMPIDTATKPRTTAIITPRVTCSKCALTQPKEFGQLSCCARGGAWFKNCGDPGNYKFDHTWLEGILACKSKFAFI